MFAKIVDNPAHVAVYAMDNAHVVVHVALILPFGKCFSRKFVFLKLLDNGVVMLVPLFSL